MSSMEINEIVDWVDSIAAHFKEKVIDDCHRRQNSGMQSSKISQNS